MAFVIFWAATFAVFFFLAGIFFKALLSAFHAFFNAIGAIVAIGGLTMLVILALDLVYTVVDGGMGNIVSSLIMFVIGAGMLAAIFGGLGALILGIVITVMEKVLEVITFILEKAIRICDIGYAKSLTAIMRQVEKC